MERGIRLDHSVVAVSDWDVSNRFYRDVVGAELVPADGVRVMYRLGDTQLNVHGPGLDVGDNVARLPRAAGEQRPLFRLAGAHRRGGRPPRAAVGRGRAGPARTARSTGSRPERVLPGPRRQPARVHLVHTQGRQDLRRCVARRADGRRGVVTNPSTPGRARVRDQRLDRQGSREADRRPPRRGPFGARGAVPGHDGQGALHRRRGGGRRARRHRRLRTRSRGVAAVAREAGTTVVAMGGAPGRAYRPRAWETNAEVLPLFDAGEYEEIKRVLNGAMLQYEDRALLLYNLACAEAQLGETEAALEHLRAALEERSSFAEGALEDADLAPIRNDPRFAEITASSP